MRHQSSITLVACLALVIQVSGEVYARKKPDTTEGPEGVAVKRWLVLGPASDAMPAFHDASRGGVESDSLLDAARFRAGSRAPVEGAAEGWFAGQTLTWAATGVGEDGLVVLDPPEGTGAGRPAVAWLAVHVDTDRYRSVKFVCPGSGPRSVWLGGRRVASGGADGAVVEGTLDLTPGSHVVLLKAIHDGDESATWNVGLRVIPGEDGDTDVSAWSTEHRRQLTIQDVLDAPEVASLDVSPDGSLLALAVRRYLPGTDVLEEWVEVRKTSDGSLVRTWRGSSALTDVAWVPDGKRLSYVVTDKEGAATLWVDDLDAGAETAVIESVERWGGYAWSPTASAVAYWTRVEPEKDDTGIKRLENILDRQAGYRTKTYLHLVTVPGGVHRRITAGPESTSFEAFSPDGRRVLFSRHFEDLARRPYSRGELWEIDLESLEVERLLDGGWLSGASYSPDGGQLLIHAGPSMFDAAGSALNAGRIANEYDRQLYVWDRATGDVDAITREFDPAVSAAIWSRADGRIYVRAAERDRVRLYRYDRSDRSFAALPTGGIEVVDQIALAERAEVAAVRGTGPWYPQAVSVVDLSAADAREILRPADEWFAGLERGEIRAWSFTSEAGDEIDGRVYLPPGFAPDGRYPAIVYYYAGTSPVTRNFGGRYPLEWWSANGYVVYVLQPSGTFGYGQEFSARHVNDWGATTISEIIQGTRKFLEAHPFVDPEKLGCIGASYGGFATMRLITQTDMFAAAVAHAGISALTSYWGEGYWGYSYNAVAAAESFPWNRPDIFVEHSPLYHADDVSTPLLLTHGDTDPNVPPGESDQLFVALRLLGVPVEYLSISGQEHWILDHDKRIRWSSSIVAWFDRWLKGRPGWWDALYPSPEAATE